MTYKEANGTAVSSEEYIKKMKIIVHRVNEYGTLKTQNKKEKNIYCTVPI